MGDRYAGQLAGPVGGTGHRMMGIERMVCWLRTPR